MQRAKLSHRPGFTLIELLVVLAIISVLLGLLFPAVQRVRESANRTQCLNNLRQIAIAMHNHHDTVGSLPSGYLWKSMSSDDPFVTDPGWGWAAQLLPYLEQEPLAKQIDWNVAVGHPNYDALRTAP